MQDEGEGKSKCETPAPEEPKITEETVSEMAEEEGGAEEKTD